MLFVFQHLQDRSTEELCQRLESNFRHYIKIPGIGEESSRFQSMDVWMPFGIVAEDLDGQGDAGKAELFTKGNSQKARAGRCRILAQLVEQFQIVEKISAKDLRDTQHLLAMRDEEENVVLQMAAQLNHLLAMFPKGICFAAYDGQDQCPRQLKARRYSWWPSGQRTRAKPCSRSPHSRYFRTIGEITGRKRSSQTHRLEVGEC